MTKRAQREHFVCARLQGARLSTAVCGQRSKLARAPSGRIEQATGGPTHGLQRSACAGCPVGLAHRKGERPATWPDGSPIVRLAQLVRGDGLTSAPLTKAEIAKRRKAAAIARK